MPHLWPTSSTAPHPYWWTSGRQWCGPCRAVAPVLEQIAAENVERLTVAKLDVDANPLTAQQYQVVSIPTLIVFKGGQPVARIVGARGKSALLSDLSDYL